MTSVFGSWKETLLVIKPETAIRWHTEGFRLYWRRKSRSALGRPKISQVQIDVVRQLANRNALWGAPRIHLGISKDSAEPREAPTLGKIDKVAVVRFCCGWNIGEGQQP
jgi:hypothetical protein